jgi:RNase H-fold protein (predicted Holliday junction resolvase)
MSHAKLLNLIADWEQLFTAVEAHEAELPALSPFKAPLRESLDRVKESKNHQEVLVASSRQATKDLQQGVRQASSLVARLHSQVRAELGYQDERLTLFGIKPLPLHLSPKPQGEAEGTGSPDGYDVQ